MITYSARKLFVSVKALFSNKRELHFFDRDDVIGREVLRYGWFEHFQLYFVEKLISTIKPVGPSCFVDIGANIGNYTLKFSNSFDKVLAFEPNPVARGVLLANIYAANKDDGSVKVHSQALSNRKGETKFYARRASKNQNTSNLGNSGLEVDYIGSDYREIKVETAMGDEIFLDIASDQFVFCKIDAEGHETSVFEGMRRFISRCQPVFQVEIGHPNDFLEIHRMLGTEAYAALGIRAIGPRNRVLRGLMGFPYRMTEVSEMDDRTYADVFFVPRTFF